jgi:undecaprenyl diphosphate synthase
LLDQIDFARLPRHIAVIMDGNGRWANRRLLPRIAGHRAGVEAVRVTVDGCARLGIEALTLYAFSVENWKRPVIEVEAPDDLLEGVSAAGRLTSLHRNRIRFQAIGRISMISIPQSRLSWKSAIAKTAGNKGMILNLALNYGGRVELVDAFRGLLRECQISGRDPDSITEQDIARSLYTAGQPDPDLLIRTSGELRVSNFLLWQIAYAEIYVTETLWPDFRLADLFAAISRVSATRPALWRSYPLAAGRGQRPVAAAGTRLEVGRITDIWHEY